MARKRHNKLVRDRIPDVIRKNGGRPDVAVLDDPKFKRELIRKVFEEAGELKNAKTPDEVLNELVDIEELVRAIARRTGLSLKTIEKARQKKLKARGGFGKKFFLKHVDEE